jgi:Domain of unknown function (DUF4349)
MSRPKSMNPSLSAIRARARQEALRTLLIAGAVTVGAGLLLSACSGSAGSASGGGTAAGRPLFNKAAQRAGAVPRAPIAGTASGVSGAAQNGALAALTLSTQSIIFTANLTLRVKDVNAAGTAATGDVTAVGGYVSSEQEIIPQTKVGIPQINLQLKIPVAQYQQTFAKLSQLGRPLAHTQQAVDVTQRVADVNSRVASAQAEISQLRALLKKAGSVSQLLSVQNEINTQETNVEALLAQQRALAHETSFATVTMVLVGQHARPVHKHHKKPATGFATGLRGGWHALGVVVTWLLTALGSALPFLVPLALIGAIAFESRRRLARRKAPPSPEPPAASAS